MYVKELFDLKDKVAIVTGGSRGLGNQMALGLAEAGATIVICARRVEKWPDADKDILARGVKCLYLKCDIAKVDEVKNVVEKTINEFGKIDILVNNAGITWGALAEEMQLEDYEKVIRTNLIGTFIITQEVGKLMIKQKKGKIINISSIVGQVSSPYLNVIGYATSKAGLIGFTKELAAKWAKYHINVNCIAPSFFKTRMTEFMLEKGEEIIAQAIPLGRVGNEDDIKAAVVFLASRASDYITGQVLNLDGGILSI